VAAWIRATATHWSYLFRAALAAERSCAPRDSAPAAPIRPPEYGPTAWQLQPLGRARPIHPPAPTLFLASRTTPVLCRFYPRLRRSFSGPWLRLWGRPPRP